MHTQSHIPSHTTVEDNRNNTFSASEWIFETDGPQALQNFGVLLFQLELYEEQKYDQFCQHILATKASDPSISFYKSDDGPLLSQYLFIPRQQQMIMTHKFQKIMWMMVYHHMLAFHHSLEEVNVMLLQTK